MKVVNQLREEEEQMSECTFKPQINFVSRQISNRTPREFFEEQQRWKNLNEVKRKIQSEQEEYIQTEGYTYRPQLTQKSRILAERSNRQEPDVVQRLYKRQQDVEMHIKNQSEEQLKQFFKPQISQNSNKIFQEMVNSRPPLRAS